MDENNNDLRDFLYELSAMIADTGEINLKFIQNRDTGGQQVITLTPSFPGLKRVVQSYGEKDFVHIMTVSRCCMKKSKTVFAFVGTGYFSEDLAEEEINDISEFLDEALLLIDKDIPIRGPQEYKKGKYSYFNQFVGGLDQCKGTEWITFDFKGKSKKVYSMEYTGRKID